MNNIYAMDTTLEASLWNILWSEVYNIRHIMDTDACINALTKNY